MGRFLRLLALLFAACGAFAAPGEPAAAARAGVQAELRDIRGPLALASPPPFVLSGGVLLLAAGLFLASRRNRRRGLPMAAQTAPAAATGADANVLLARLAADYRQGICPGDLLLTRLDGLIRSVLDATTGIPATRLTSLEIPARAAAVLEPEEQELLDGLLALCDQAKFAAYRPGPDEVERALDAAGKLIAGKLAGQMP
jgi:hypothetical protein